MSKHTPSLFATNARYFCCPRPETYRTLVGEVVTYFTPEWPGGFVEDDMNASECERLARRYPALCGEANEEDVRAIRHRLDAAVAEHKARQARERALEATPWKPASERGAA